MTYRFEHGITLLLLLILCTTPLRSVSLAATFHVDAYGAQPDNPAFNSAPAFFSAINAALANGGENEVVIGTGKYYLSAPADAQPFLLIQNAHDLTIRGQGIDHTWIINTRPRGGGFQFMQGKNILLRDFTYDHSPLPFTQGTVVARNRNSNYIDVQIDAGFPIPNEDWYTDPNLVSFTGGRWGMVFDPANRRMKIDAPDFIFLQGNVLNLGGGIYRFATDGSIEQDKINTIDVGDLFVCVIRPVIGGAIFFYQTEFATAEHIKIHASPSLAITSINATRTTIRGSSVEPLASENRLISTNGDGWHFQQDRVGPHIENTYLKGMADDGVAINTFPNQISSVVDNRTLIIDSTVLVLPGDDIILFNPRDGEILLDATVQSLIGISPPPDVTTTFAYEIVLDRDIPSLTLLADRNRSDQFFNLSAGSNDYIIRDNTFDHHRGRSIFVQSARGLIEGNIINNTSSYGIVVANEPSWPLGPIPTDMIIRDNNVTSAVENEYWFAGGSLSAAIQVRGSRENNTVATTRLIENVVISGNTVIDPPATGIYVAATTNALIFDNQVVSTGSRQAPKNDEAIVIDQVGGSVLVDNTVTDTPSTPLFRDGLRLTSTVDNECGGMALLNLSTLLANGRQPIRDLRAVPGNYLCTPADFAFPVFLSASVVREYDQVAVGEDILLDIHFPENTSVTMISASNFELVNLMINQITTTASGFRVSLSGIAEGNASLQIREGVLANQFGWTNVASRIYPLRITPPVNSSLENWWVY